jgi:hypothetical protein
MKEQYELLEMEIIEFDKEDVIVTSGEAEDVE